MSSLSTEVEDLRKYAEYLKNMYRSDSYIKALEQYVKMDFTEHLTYTQLAEAVKSMPKTKAP